MTKIHLTLTEDQARTLRWMLDSDRTFTESDKSKAFLTRIITKISNELAKAKTSTT